MTASAGAMSIIESVGHLASFFVRASEQDKTDHKRKTYLENLFDAKLLKKELSDQCIAAVEKGYTDLNLWAGVVNRLMLLLFPQSRNARCVVEAITLRRSHHSSNLNLPLAFQGHFDSGDKDREQKQRLHRPESSDAFSG